MSAAQASGEGASAYPARGHLLSPLTPPTQAQNLLSAWSPPEVWLETGQPTHLPRLHLQTVLGSTEPHSAASAVPKPHGALPALPCPSLQVQGSSQLDHFPRPG